MKTREIVVPVKVEVSYEGLDMSMDDLVKRFRFHKATDVTGPQHAIVRLKCFELASELHELLPEGREKSLAITKLEEVMFWANAAIARNPGDPELEDEVKRQWATKE